MKKLLISISLLLCVNVIYATQYYVSSVSGDDNNPGSLQFPWRTATKVSAMNFVAGDFIHFAGGEPVIGVLTIHNSGTVGNPITFDSYGTGKALFSGLTTVSSWVSVGTNLWESSTSVSNLSDCNLVMVDGVNTPMGRYPNTGWLHIDSYVGKTSITSSSLTTNWTGGDVVFKPNHFTSERSPISSQSGTTINYATTTTENFSDGNGLFIENDSLTLDVQNEWWYSPSRKKLRMYSTTTPSNVQLATSDTLIYLVQKSNIKINNFSFKGANRRAIFAASIQNLTVTNCDFDYMGLYAFWGGSNFGLSSDNLIFSNNTINHTGSYGIVLGSEYSNPYISNNSIKNCGVQVGMFKKPTATSAYPGSYGGIAASGCDGYTAEYNRIDSIGYDGMQVYGLNMTMRYNEITHCLLNLEDGGGINVINAGGHTSAGTKIYNNIIHDNTADNSGTTNTVVRIAHGIYLDIGIRHLEMYGNSCFNNSYSGIGLGLDDSCYVHNNYCSNNAYTQYFEGGDIGAGTHKNDTSKNNQFVAFASTQLAYNFWANTFTSAKTLYSVLDSNYITRPISDSLTIRLSTNSFTIVSDYTLAMWQANLGYDLHSKKSLVKVTSLGQFLILYNPTNHDSTVAIPSGSWKDITGASFATSTVLHQYTSLTLINTGSLITPIITYNNPTSIVYGTALSSTQLNATANVPGSFTYTIGSTTASVGTILNAGTYTITANFTPTDPSTYSSASKTVTLIVTQAAATLTASNTTQTYNGSPLQPTIATSPSGLTVISTTYNGVGQIPTNAGSYSCVSGLSNQNYSAPSISYTFTISKATAVITVSNLNQVYTGSPLPVTVTTSPSVSGISVTYNGSATVPTNAGSYTVVASLTNANYTATTVTTTLVIAKATPTVSWAAPSAITYGTALSATQLNATASVAGTFTYTPVSGTVLNAGTQTLSVNFTPTNANYNVVNNTTVSLIVNKATATLTLSGLTPTYTGSALPVMVTTSPTGLNGVTVTYNGSTTVPINAGSYSIIASLTNPNYTATNVTGTEVIAKATATLSLSGLTQTYNGTAKTVTVTVAPAGLTVITTTYNGSTTAPVNAGSYPVVASLSNANYTATNATGTLVVNQATPVITWSTPSAITYGPLLSATQLNATSTVAGTFTYTPAPGTLLNAGTTILSVNFSPTDLTNYKVVNGTTTSLVVNKATATLLFANLIQTYDGNPKPITVTTSPAGLTTTSVTYNGSGTAPSAVGTYTVIANLVNSNYTATPDTATLTILASVDSVTISNLAQIYTGSPLPVKITTYPGTYTTDTTYNGAHVTPTDAGTYIVIARINDGTHTGTDTATYIISKATPVITWSNPANIVYGTSLWTTQLNATASVAGTFTYTPPIGTILNVGTSNLSTSFAPTNTLDYNTVGKVVSITVVKDTTTLTLTNLSQTYDGTQKFATSSTTTPAVVGTVITYNGSTTAPTAVGSYTVIATLTNSNYYAVPDTATLVISPAKATITITGTSQVYTGSISPVTVTTNPLGLSTTTTYNGSTTAPTNVGSYTVISTITDPSYTGADTVTEVITKKIATITWANPANIIFGTALSGTQLNATANVAGAFTYTPVSGTVLSVGSGQVLSTVFTPTDTANITGGTASVTINVVNSTANISISGLSQAYDGQPKPVTVSTTPANLSGIVVTYNGSTSVPVNAGSYTVIATLVNSNYTATPDTATLVISKATPVLAWTQPVQVMEGTVLSSTQLNATSNIAGTFTYSPASGYVLPAGLIALTANFTPSDAVNYNISSITVYLTVYGSPFLNYLITNDIYKNH